MSSTVEAVISVVRIKELSSGSLKAFVDVELCYGSDVIQLKGFKVMDGSKGLWVGVPSNPTKTPNPKTGKVDWFPTMEFSTSLEFAIKDAVLAAFESKQSVKSQIPQKPKAGTTTFRENTASSSSSSEEDIPF